MSAIVNDRDVLLQAASPRLDVVASLVYGSLTRDSFVAPASSAGVVSSFTGCGGTFKVFNGATDVTTSCAFSILSNPDGLTASIGAATGVYAVTAAGAWADASRVTFLTLRAGFAGVTIDKVFTVTKAVAGTAGGGGAPGSRGTVTITAATAGSSWSDSEANAAIAAAGYGSPQSRDIVTLYNTAAKYSEQRFYSLGSWIVLSFYLPGNALIDGTVSALMFDGVGLNIGSTGGITVDSFGATDLYNAFGHAMSFGNLIDPSKPAVNAEGVAFSNSVAILGKSVSTLSTAHGIRGWNSHYGTLGLVGVADASHAFYAEVGTYGPFTGAHDAIVPNGTVMEPGDIVVDVLCRGKRGVDDTIYEVARSTYAGQKRRRGVFSRSLGPLADHGPAAMTEGWTITADGQPMPIMSGAYYELADTHERISMNGVGEGQINVCGQNGDFGEDDLVVISDIPGKGMRQLRDGAPDDQVRTCTVAQVREAVTFDSPDQVKLVPCIYLCG